ncbi:NADH-quinone oxidoreductase subunit NuoF [Sediminispirochaeta bajacaliforniensis]|uniref:NADH-quinone oxidoreductase subunit NuoF n=1 Tax=Sediminispirochaeta bajacaliforniensis TaxID=148 RepID=UPI000363119D|nr:NADH-quinone oxidoreductase subunit NuoF [Sediminispirochaeta bajacaliforniensis]
MKRIGNSNELTQVQTQLCASERKKTHLIRVCAGGGCLASGSIEVMEALESNLKELAVDASVKKTGCLGPCARGPVVMIEPEGLFYEGVHPEDCREICESLYKAGKNDTVAPIEHLLHYNRAEQRSVVMVDEVDFYRGQAKIVLSRCGVVDPDSIEDAIACGAYSALARVLSEDDTDKVIDTLKKSGLRGRGGAGFPTWLKWDFTRKSPGEEKYVLCNADEGDPGAFMDRSVLEGDPHALIEGMAIAGKTIGADHGVVYVRAEYPLAVKRLGHAIEEAKESGLLGENILGSEFNFDIEIRMGSGAFVCGEETALIASIEGRRGEPRPRPPFPANKGLWGKPSLLNNVETYANIAGIIKKGAEWYASFGTAESKGTKVFALAGAISTSGLVEVPIGTCLGEVVFDIGGGIPGGKEFKAAQIGGPSGGCIPREYLNVPLDYASLQELGAIMGSGGLIVMDDDTCMVDVARYFLEFVQEESCGKCTPCRVGTKRMLEILERICNGKGEMEDIDRLIELGTKIKETALCGLGQTAPNPVLSTIRHFRHEYEEHIRDHHCTAGVCPALVRAPCQSACPAGVDIPGFISLVKERRYAEALRLHRERNPFAAVCARVCFHTCEDKCRRAGIDEAVAIRAIKRYMVDQEVTVQRPEVREDADREGRKVAIIGAGPAGLSCGYFLARLGYRPRIFEAQSRPGGMLVQTIPAYRLPRETLAREIRMIEQIGVDIVTDKRLGRDFSLQDLRDEGYEAIFIAVGAPGNLRLGIRGEAAEGVVQGIDFLRTYNIRGSVSVGERIVVVGGGNAAVDAARTAIRLGAKEVTMLYRRSREQMPAYAEEIEEALLEGVKLMSLTQPSEILTDGKGAVRAIRCHGMTLGEFDRSGRRRPTDDEAQPFEIETDQIIIAIGQALDKKTFAGATEIPIGGNRFIAANQRDGSTAIPWLFAGGDAATGPNSVVSAIASGEKAAVGIDAALFGSSDPFWRKEKKLDTDYDPTADPVPYPREKIPTIEIERRKNNFDEVEKTWTESVAIRQCARCLRCDYGKEQV